MEVVKAVCLLVSLLPLCHAYSITRIAHPSFKAEDTTSTVSSLPYSWTSSIEQAPLVTARASASQHFGSKEERNLGRSIEPLSLLRTNVDRRFRPSVQLSEGNVNFLNSPSLSSYSFFVPSSWPKETPVSHYEDSLKTSTIESLPRLQRILPVNVIIQKTPEVLVESSPTVSSRVPPTIQKLFAKVKITSSEKTEASPTHASSVKYTNPVPQKNPRDYTFSYDVNILSGRSWEDTASGRHNQGEGRQGENGYGRRGTPIFGHVERKENGETRGRYYVLLPDGRTQVVQYFADSTGYHPTITYYARR